MPRLRMSAALIAVLMTLAGAPAAEERGSISREYWLGIPGASLSSLTTDARFPDSPTGRSSLTSLTTGPNWADSYGERIRGYVYPPQTGNYTFSIAGDDDCQLWLSTSDDPAAKVLIASITGWTGPQEWTKFSSQQSVSIALSAGQRYFLEVLHKEGGGSDSVAVAWSYGSIVRQVIPGECLSPFVAIPVPGQQGTIRRELWLGIAGTSLSALRASPTFPASPTTTDFLTTFEAPTSIGDNYGTRLRGYLHPPQSGQYTFYIAGDDECQLWLSPSDSAPSKLCIASVPGSTAPRDWLKYTQQKSVQISLEAGSAYYIEALHKEGGGGDCVAVAWMGPGIGETPTVIAGAYLSPSDSANPVIPPGQGSGGILAEKWTGITGNAVSSLLADPGFPQYPAERTVLSEFKTPTNVSDNYGTRVRGYLCPEISGDYRFWLASDDQSTLKLSPDADPSHALPIASVSAWTGVEQWEKYPEQASQPVSLVAGQKYYIEAIQKEGTGGDHLAVAWSGPSVARSVIEGRYLAPVFLPVIEGSSPFEAQTVISIAPSRGPAVVHFTTDGSTPNASSPIYEGPITVTQSTVVRAICIDGSNIQSDIADRAFIKAGTGTGLTAAYFPNEYFAGTAVVRVDPKIDFVWGKAAPFSGIPADHFSVRWQGELEVPMTESYSLNFRSDDGARVWIDGTLLINDWTYHGAKDHIVPVTPGKHRILIEYMEGIGDASAQLWWSSTHQTKQPVPTSQLYPINGISGVIPASSKISPAFVEVTHPTGSVITAAISEQSVPLSVLDDFQGYVNVTLSQSAPTPLAFFVNGNADLSGTIAWEPTDIEDGSETVLRKNDSLLFYCDQPGTVSITTSSGTFLQPTSVIAGQLLPVKFTNAGDFVVHYMDMGGAQIAAMDVTVVAVTYPVAIAGEVGFERPLEVLIYPAAAPLSFMGNTQLSVTVVSAVGDEAQLKITPWRRGSPRILARINGPAGPLVADQLIDEFTFGTNAAASMIVFGHLETGITDLTMRPYIPNVTFTNTMFAHRSTFRGGDKVLKFNTSDVDPSTGVAYMPTKQDPATGEMIGVAPVLIEVPTGETAYCFHTGAEQVMEYPAEQSNPQGFAALASSPLPEPLKITTRKNTNGCACPIKVGPGIYVVPETTDESGDNLDTASGTGPRQQRDQKWESRAVTFPIKEGDCATATYKLTLVPNEPCGGGPDQGLGTLPSLQGTAPCEANHGPGGCPGINEMNFLANCDKVWPIVGCEACSNECLTEKLSTGILPATADLVLKDCASDISQTGAKFFTIVRFDLDGYSGTKPRDPSGADDNSTRDEMPTVCANALNFSPDWKTTVFGTPVQGTLIAPEGVTLKVRIMSRHPDRVRVSDQPSVVIPPNTNTSTKLDAVLPRTCIVKEMRVTGSECKAQTLFYLYGVEKSPGANDTWIEVDVEEPRYRCGSSDLEEYKEWGVADTEAITITPRLPIGREVTFPGKFGSTCLWVPEYHGGKLVVTANGGSMSLKYDGAEVASAGPGEELMYDVPKSAGKHGWYCLSVRNGAENITVSNTFRQDGECDYQPWTFWYYPDSPSVGGPHLFDVGEGPWLYDRGFPNDGAGSSSPAFEQQERAKRPGAASWHGHCHSMAAASMLFAAPTAPVTIPASSAPAGVDVTFGIEEQEALLGVWMGQRYGKNGGIVQIWVNRNGEKPKVGKDSTNKIADNIFRCIRDAVYLEKQAILADLEESSGSTRFQRWNQVIFKSSATFVETDANKDYFDLTIDHEYTANDDRYPSPDSLVRTQNGHYRLIFGVDGLVDQNNKKQDYMSLLEGGTSMFPPGYGMLLKPLNPGAGTPSTMGVYLKRLTDAPPNGLGLKFNDKVRDITTAVPKETSKDD